MTHAPFEIGEFRVIDILALCIALGAGVIGIVAKTRRDEVQSSPGIDVPSWPGWILLVLLVSAFGVGLGSHVIGTREQAERDAAAHTTLETTQATLDNTVQTLDSTQANLEQQRQNAAAQTARADQLASELERVQSLATTLATFELLRDKPLIEHIQFTVDVSGTGDSDSGDSFADALVPAGVTCDRIQLAVGSMGATREGKSVRRHLKGSPSPRTQQQHERLSPYVGMNELPVATQFTELHDADQRRFRLSIGGFGTDADMQLSDLLFLTNSEYILLRLEGIQGADAATVAAYIDDHVGEGTLQFSAHWRAQLAMQVPLNRALVHYDPSTRAAEVRWAPAQAPTLQLVRPAGVSIDDPRERIGFAGGARGTRARTIKID